MSIFFYQNNIPTLFPSLGFFCRVKKTETVAECGAQELCKARNQWTPRHSNAIGLWGERKCREKRSKTYIRLKASRLPVIERHCPLVSAVVVFVYRLKARRCVL
jgi:hypothetical protein